MVSKSKILGKSSLIFITVGTTNFQFDRLFKAIDHALIKTNYKINVVVQQGNSHYKWKYNSILVRRSLYPAEFTQLVKKSSKIICHGGFGSLYEISKNTKIQPIIVSRLKKFREHVDDHQKFFLSETANRFPSKYQKFFLTEDNIVEKIEDYINQRKTPQNLLKKYLFKSNINSIKKNLIYFIENK